MFKSSTFIVKFNFVFGFREWKEGLFGSLLRKFCIQPCNSNYSVKTKPIMKIMQLDGEV